MATIDYSALTVDELLTAEAKTKKQRIVWAFILGGFVGILLWAVVLHASFGKVVLLVLFFGAMASGGKKNEENFKAIEAELQMRNIR